MAISNKAEYTNRLNQLLAPGHTIEDLRSNTTVMKQLHDECDAGGFSPEDIARTLNEYYNLKGLFAVTAKMLHEIKAQHNF